MIFLLYALFAGILSSIAGGIVGSYVVVKRIAFISGAIAHAVLSGMGLFLFLSLPPLYGALAAAILSALLIGWIHLRYREREDAVIAAVWAVGMALGVIFVSLTPGTNVDLMHFLLGNILWVTPQDLILLGALDIVVIVVAWSLHTRFSALCFDETQARLQKVPVGALYLLLLVLIALTTVLLIQVVGIVLVIAMLTLPPSIANLYSRKLSHMIFGAVGLGILLSVAGIALSYWWDWPPGATIAFVTGVVYLLLRTTRKKLA